MLKENPIMTEEMNKKDKVCEENALLGGISAIFICYRNCDDSYAIRKCIYSCSLFDYCVYKYKVNKYCA